MYIIHIFSYIFSGEDPDTSSNQTIWNGEWRNSWPGRSQYDESFQKYNKFSTFIEPPSDVVELDEEVDQLTQQYAKTHLE